MKIKLLNILLLGFCANLLGQSTNPRLDSLLADSLGGDDYGMKSYVLVILKTGPKKIKDKQVKDSLFMGHLQNIRRLAAMGKLVVAGPLEKNDKHYRGICILNVKTKQEADSLLQTDTTIKNKLLQAELYQWYGSAALPTYLPIHEKIERKRI